jgi:hypothetical protein
MQRRGADDPDPPAERREAYAARAARAYAAMQDCFRTRRGRYRHDGLLRWPGTAAHLWPFSRALVAMLDLAGIGEGVGQRCDAAGAIAEHLDILERYWDSQGPAPAYSSDVIGTRIGGDRYYDDNAWVGLALVQLERLRPGAGRIERARELFRFAVSGWDPRADVPSPGGVFWVEQGRGIGAKNHDRNTVSNAPNAELGLHLAELTGAPVHGPGSIGPEDMYEWVNASLDASGGGDVAATGLFWDKRRGDDTLDEALWSYNQGSMVGANVLLHRAAGKRLPEYLFRAEAIARKALRQYAGGGLERQPAAFNAIFFRNLLLLHEATGEAELRTQIIDAMRAYTDRAWSERRDRRDRFHFSRRRVTLLDQSAMVQLLALLAWDPLSYRKLA